MRSLVSLPFAFALVSFAACGAQEDAGNNPDGGVGDANGCGTYISFDPSMPEASTVSPIRAVVHVVAGSGVFTYTWTVTDSSFSTVSQTMEAADNSQIGFIAADPGPYYVDVTISGPTPPSCNHAEGTINVLAPNASTEFYRLRAVPPSGVAAPPQEQIIQIRGGADYDRAISLEPGFSLNLTVQQTSGAGVPAYVKLMPVSTPHAFTEVFTAANGTFTARVLGVPHNALVIPTSTSFAPKLLSLNPTSPTGLVVSPGTVVSGVVRGPGGSGLSGAKVQLTSSNVPSTIGTTAADGSFSLRADFIANAPITVKVTPTAASGLPRLEATGLFTLASSMQITYSAALATCDLGGSSVQRSGANQGNARVTVVGTLPGTSGSVVTGSVTANATGTVRVASTASGGGALPAMLVPRAPLSAVVELANGELAVDPIDTSTCPSIVIDAPAQITRTGTVRNISNAALGGAVIEATPVGALALADAQAVTRTTNASGGFSIPLASGGRYDVRFIDPFARSAPLEGANLTNITPASVPTAPVLPKALIIKGKLSLAGNANPIEGASVQVLCQGCTGIAAARPLAETTTNNLSAYRIAVPDPGTQ